MIFLHPATFSPSVFTDYQRFRFTYYWRFRVRSVPLNGSWLQEIRAFACFLRVRWGLPKLWLVFVIAPFRAARRIYGKYLRAGTAFFFWLVDSGLASDRAGLFLNNGD
jgi:hypothetical protein